MKSTTVVIILMLCSIGLFSQFKSDTVFYSTKTKNIKEKLIANKKIGMHDTTIATVQGEILDNENKGINSEIIVFNKSTKKKLLLTQMMMEILSFMLWPDFILCLLNTQLMVKS